MSHRSLVNAHLKTYGHRISVPDLALADDGYCGIVFGEGAEALQVNIEVMEGAGAVCFYCSFGAISTATRGEMAARLISAHLFGLATRGCFFAMHPDTGDALACSTWTHDELNYHAFERTIDHVLAAARHGREVLGAASAGPASGSSPPGVPGRAIRV